MSVDFGRSVSAEALKKGIDYHFRDKSKQTLTQHGRAGSEQKVSDSALSHAESENVGKATARSSGKGSVKQKKEPPSLRAMISEEMDRVERDTGARGTDDDMQR